MNPTPDHYVITCIVWNGATKPFLSKLARERGIWSFFFNGSRLAVADHTRLRARVQEFIENEEITILVPADRLDEIFAFVYEELGIGRPGRGVIHVTRVLQAVPFTAPEPSEEGGGDACE